jgi:hypothetical protein
MSERRGNIDCVKAATRVTPRVSNAGIDSIPVDTKMECVFIAGIPCVHNVIEPCPQCVEKIRSERSLFYFFFIYSIEMNLGNLNGLPHMRQGNGSTPIDGRNVSRILSNGSCLPTQNH